MSKSSILLGGEPKCLTIDGRDYKINTDFRVFVKFELMMQDRNNTDNSDDDKLLLYVLSDFYYGNVPDNRSDAADKMLEFYRIHNVNASGSGHAGEKMIYSFEHDGDRIFASFRRCYGIDLSCAALSWRQFHALLDNLPEDSEFMKAVMYRSMKISGDLPRKERERLMELKRFYALPDNRTAAEKERDFANVFATMF